MLLDGLLNRSVTGLGSLGLISVYLSCNKDIYVSISFMEFSIILFTNLCTPLLVHCFDDYKMMILHDIC